jgi:hypothetical protein
VHLEQGRERIKEWADDSKSTHAIDHGCFVRRVKPEDDISVGVGHGAETLKQPAGNDVATGSRGLKGYSSERGVKTWRRVVRTYVPAWQTTRPSPSVTPLGRVVAHSLTAMKGYAQQASGWDVSHPTDNKQRMDRFSHSRCVSSRF